jgi:cytochrome c553
MHRTSLTITAALMLLATQARAQGGAQDAPPATGRNLAATCASCHGTQGAARAGMAVLAGVSAEQLLARLADYRSGTQPATVMGQIAKGYSEAQLRQVAAYFAALPVPR